MKKIYLLVALLGVFSFVGCNDDTPTTEPTVKLKNPVNDFTWQAMNFWYNWQGSMPNLADTKDDNKNDYHTYLNSFSKPQELFKSLLYQPGKADRFSWFIENYEEQGNAFQGVYKGLFGFSYSKIDVDNTKSILLIRQVSETSPAKQAGLKRGDIIIGFNNRKFANENFNTVLNEIEQNTVEFILGENDGVTEKKRITITRGTVVDNAIGYHTVFNDVAGRKVGYLVYNGFRATYNDELNNVFSTFKSEGIQELILDLRYNRGGSVATSSYLASMICDKAGTDNFAELRFNSKRSKQNSNYKFDNKLSTYELDANGRTKKTGEQPINRVSGLNRLYVITTKITASASEMIINGLKPFMEVITIGDETYGKNVGSITLLDSPETGYTDPNYLKDSNPSKAKLIEKLKNKPHKNAMQPIVFQIYNKLGQSDYTFGFAPTIPVEEKESWKNFLSLGNKDEILLKTALNHIKGISGRPTSNSSILSSTDFQESNFDKEMYIEESFVIKN